MAVEARVIDRNGQQVVVFPDGTEVPLVRVQAAMAQRPAADVQAPPRADAPMSVSAGPSYSFGDVGRGVGNEELSAAYDTLSSATNVGTYDPILAASRYAGNMGQAGLLGAIGAGKKIGGYAADALGAGYEALGGDRFAKGGAAEAMYRDMGAGIQTAGVGPEARMLDVLSSAGAGRSAVDAADLTAREALAYARSVGEGDLAFLRGGGVGQSLGAASKVGNIDPAISRGQGILDMLKSGRGADVTDEMLDMGDPVANARLNQYLYQNYDLPMDEAARMQRAVDMGFDTDTPMYHGTGADFTGFDSSKAGLREAGWYGNGIYSTALQDLAGGYAESARFDAKNAPNVVPILVRRGKEYEWGSNPIATTRAESEAFRENLVGLGYDTVRVPNNYANDLMTAKEAANYEVVSFDPANIRSRFARFDPRLAHLRNLSAAAAGTGLLGVGMQNRDRQEM